jgi:hypothetical protein
MLFVLALNTSRSTVTLMQAGFPDALARSSAGRICDGSVTFSPYPPMTSMSLS